MPATADKPDIAARFPTDALFQAIRLDPYLVTAAKAHPDLSRPLLALVATTGTTRRTLVHGDFSPKNILVGSEGPVFLDAECAWYGDPAFDLAFVLNHLLLKGVWRPDRRSDYLTMFAALCAAYRFRVNWEPWADAGGAHGGAAARIAAGARRRQVAGRIRDRRARPAGDTRVRRARTCCGR